MRLARLALQVGLIFCIISVAVGLGAELSTETIIWRSLLCALAGAAIGAGIGALTRWLQRISEEGSGLPAEATADGAPPAGEPVVAATSEEPGAGG